ncbi:hypothetical protein [Streptomyces spectabilis]|uniref:hypothetical protein n=1 Tax=Streptomyces spectabilis TaxID=68270 RepID=UPI003F4D0A0A
MCTPSPRAEAGIRFGALAGLFDPVTLRHMGRLGIGKGMRCWGAAPGRLPCPDASGPEQRLVNRMRSDVRTLMAERGADLAYGRTLSRALRGAGLADVQADAYFGSASIGGSRTARSGRRHPVPVCAAAVRRRPGSAGTHRRTPRRGRCRFP